MTVWQALEQEWLADVPSAESMVRTVVRLLVAAILGAILGFEREEHGKTAGLRTHMLVAVGCAAFVLAAIEDQINTNDLARVIQGIATGIGFIGGGAILKISDEHRIRGLTTAANIWLAAAIGVAAGMGQFATAVCSTLLGLTILVGLGWLEKVFKSDRGNPQPPAGQAH